MKTTKTCNNCKYKKRYAFPLLLDSELGKCTHEKATFNITNKITGKTKAIHLLCSTMKGKGSRCINGSIIKSGSRRGQCSNGELFEGKQK